MVLLDTAGRGQGLETVILEGVLDRGGRCAPGGVRRKAKGLRLNWSFRYQGTEKKQQKSDLAICPIMQILAGYHRR